MRCLFKLSSIVEDAEITGMNVFQTLGANLGINAVKNGIGSYDLIISNGFLTENTALRINPTDGTSSPAAGMFFVQKLSNIKINIWSQNMNDDLVDINFKNLDLEIEIV